MTTAQRRIWGVAAGAAVVVILVWYLAIFRPQSNHLHAAHVSYAQTEQQITQLRTKVASLEAIESQVPQDKARLQQLTAAVPSQPDLKDVLNQLQTLAVTSGVQLTSVNPTVGSTNSSSSTSASGPQVIQATLAASGSYQQLMGFVSGLASLQRTVVIESTTIGTGSNGALAANFNVELFYNQ